MDDWATLAVTVVTRTPLYVFPLFGLLVFAGAQALRSRVVSPSRLAAGPAALVIWGIASPFVRGEIDGSIVGAWLLLFGVSGAGAWRWSWRRGVAHTPEGRLLVDGSIGPLVRYMLIFFGKYAAGGTMALAPDLAGGARLADGALSGFAAGYSIVWLVRLWRLRDAQGQ
jgi:hypothetical protein